MYDPDFDDDDMSSEDVGDSTKSLTQWAELKRDVLVPTGRSFRKLIPGVYAIKYSYHNGLMFCLEPIEADDLVRFSGGESERVVKEMEKFWKSGDHFRKCGFIHKRGLLLFGPPGCGKTSICRLVINDVVERGGVVIKVSGVKNLKYEAEAVKIFRQVQEKTPLVVLIEDIDSILENDPETLLVNMLDGVETVSNCVFIATTNNCENLEPRIANRPSRFDWQIYVGPPDELRRKEFLTALFKRTEHESISMLEEWVRDTEGLSFAHIKEVYASVVLFHYPYKEALDRIKKMKDTLEDKEKASKKAGFRR